jgi:hypothetical protein
MERRNGWTARGRAGAGIVGLVAGAMAFSGSSAALASTTISPMDPGNVVREDTLTIDVNPGAFTFTRLLSTSAFTRQSPLGLTSSCKGDNPAGTNESPRSVVRVTGPGGIEMVHGATSPARDTSITGALASPPYPVLTPQPAPNNTNYLGDVPPTASVPSRGWSTVVNLAGRPAGMYTVTTATLNMVKTGSGPCVVGTPVSDGSGGFTNAAPTFGPVIESTTFEYRPWRHRFVDVLGGGTVKLNVLPAELRQTVGGQAGAVIGGSQTFYAVPAGEFVALPADPAVCVVNPAGCLPPGSVECNPATCTTRISIVNFQDATQQIVGFFDLDTKGFIAFSSVGGITRVMASLGTALDGALHGLLSPLATAAATGQGIDLARLLAT